MAFNESMLQRITAHVCQSMLGLELTSIGPTSGSANQLVAAVEIRGVRRMIVEVFAHNQLMASIAEVMFASDRGTLTEDEIHDAFCEIANMIGGNVKGRYGEEADLSLPSFGVAYDNLENLPDDSIRTTFECCGYPLTIVLREVLKTPETVVLSA